ncbi:MAG: HAAS signaling domain-containing protein [Candidatus Aminicenantales bacterium]
MSDKLENYLNEIGHYLAVGPARKEILSEIRSHLLEKTEEARGLDKDAALERAIADYGPARQVAERYLEGQEIIAPSYQRYLFRYTALLFAAHFLLALLGVIFRDSFVIFPFLYVPRMGLFDLFMYLPMAFLADLGIVALILYFVTRSKKNIKLPWPKYSVDLDNIAAQAKPALRSGLIGRIIGTTAMLALTVAAAVIFSKYGTIFFFGWHGTDFRPLFTPETGRYLSLILIGSWGFGTLMSFAHIFSPSLWLRIVSDVVSLAIVGLFLRVRIDESLIWPVDEHLRTIITNCFYVSFLVIALLVTGTLVKNLVILGKRKLAAERVGRPRD